MTPKDQVLDWTIFNCDIYSSELPTERVIEEVCNQHKLEIIDLRPYIIEDPISVQTQSKFTKIVELFRMHHLRHLPVTSEEQGELKGVITRADIFKYMSL